MSVKLLVVDDEFIIREGIKTKMDWNRLGVELVAVAENGYEALETLKAGPVDILITDIRMPVMDGIQLSREAMKLHPNLKIIILTGYEEFEYAKQALELSALSYMLKPFTKQELEDTILLAKREIIGHRTVESHLKITMERLEQSFPLLKERYLNQLVSERLPLKEIKSRLQLVDIHFQSDTFAVMIVELDKTDGLEQLPEHDGNSELLQLVVKDEAEQYLQTVQPSVVFSGLNSHIVCIIDIVKSDKHDELFELAENMKAYIENTLQVSVSVGIGGIKHGIKGIPESFREAMEAIEYRFLVGKSSIIPIDYINIQSEQTIAGLSDSHAERIIAVVRSGNKLGIRGELDAIFTTIKEMKTSSISDIKLYMKEFLVKTITRLLHSSIRLRDMYSRDYDPYSLVDDYQTINDMHKGIRTLYFDISDYIRDKRGNKQRKVIEKAIEEIQANYDNENLSIQMLSEQLQMNTSYLSRLFKQEAGNTFTEFLAKYRIEKAKQYLVETTLRVSEITYRVGLKDPFYFSTLFKKYVGQNPTDYREQR